jgi:lysophospholipid acyltransferase (LPLAT)-like uncharacterized protein
MAWHIPPRLAVPVICALYRPWCDSLRLTHVNRGPADALLNAGTPFVAGLWHNEYFTLTSLREHFRVMAIASLSRDGNYTTGVLTRLGFVVVRGSSSRGGTGALLACIRHMREDGLSPAITLDGPRGPRHQTKDGAIFLASQAKAPILPVRALPDRCFRFTPSWDRFELPLPFSKVRVVYGDPYTIDRELDEKTLAEERDKLNRIMHDLGKQ